MKSLFLFIFCFLIAILQLSVVGVFFPARRIPDLALVFVITLVLTIGFKDSWKWILLAGILIDAGSSTIFGTDMLIFFLLGWIISWIAEVADIRTRKILFLAIFTLLVVFSNIINDLLILMSLKIKASYFQQPSNISLPLFTHDYLFKLVYTVLAAYVIYYIFRKASRTLFADPVRLVKRNF